MLKYTAKEGFCMEKKIKRLILSVLITVILVLISVPLWNYSSGRKGSMLASSYGDLSITINIGTFPDLIVIEDDRALEYIDETPVILRNPNDTTKKFDMYYLLDKNSSIDYKDIVLSLDKNIYHLKDLEFIEDNDNYYFKINTMSLGAYSDKTFKVRIWLDENISHLDEDMVLISNFITR